MPKGFLVKRQKNRACYSWRRRNSEDERSDSGSGSELEVPVLHVGSPDSGYSRSPVNPTFNPEVTSLGNENRAPASDLRTTKITVCSMKEAEKVRHLSGGIHRLPDPRISPNGALHIKDFSQRVSMLGSTSPLNIAAYPPFYFPTFDRLSVTSPNAKTKLSVNGNFIHATTNYSSLMPTTNSSSRAPSLTPPIAGVQQQQQQNSQKIATAVLSPPAKLPPTFSPKKRSNDGELHLASKPKTSKKTKAIRRIQFEEADKRSPVSGTIIKEFSDSDDEGIKVTTGDIDSSLNFVEATPEARAELDKIDNKIGDYDCQLCKEHYDDAFQLAQHRCSRIVHVEYRCPECDKVFNCPANLASHRRWHKPRPNKNNNNTIKAGSPSKAPPPPPPVQTQPPKTELLSPKGLPSLDVMNGNILPGNGVEEPEDCRSTPSPVESSASDEGQYECHTCGKKFRRPGYLRKHLLTHTEDPYHCHLCCKGFRSETARAKHVLQHSLDSMAVNCSAPRETVICPTCSQPFPNKAALERHSKIHTGEIYNCKFCTAVFYSSPGLTRHINKCHPTENRQVILLQMPHVNRNC